MKPRGSKPARNHLLLSGTTRTDGEATGTPETHPTSEGWELCERAGGDSEQRVLGDGVSPPNADGPGAAGRGCGGACLGIKGADCGLLFHCYGFKGQWGIVVSGDPIVCFRCRSQPRSGWRFPEGQAGSVCGTLNNEAGMFPSPPPPHHPS